MSVRKKLFSFLPEVPRRRRPVSLVLGILEDRTLPDANSALGDALMQFRNDVAQLRSDMTASEVKLVNTVQLSPTNTPTVASVQSQWSKTWSVLVADWSKIEQAFVQVEEDFWAVMAQRFDTLLGIPLPGQSSSPSPTPAGTSSDSPSGSILAPVPPPAAPSDPPSTTLLSAPTGQLKQSVILTATVTGSSGTPTGNVTFLDGTTVLTTVPLNSSGQASYQTSTLTLGSHNITAIYGGSSTYGSSDAALIENIIPATSTSSLVSSDDDNGNVINVGQSVTLTDTVTGASGTPSGSVTFYDNSSVLTTVALSGGVATYTYTATSSGGHDINALYNGDSTYASSMSDDKVRVTPDGPVCYTGVSSSAAPSYLGQSVTFTANVGTNNYKGTPTGSVTFYDGSTSLGSGTLNSQAVTTYTTTALTKGVHNILAVYGGNYPGSVAILTQIVNAAPTITSLSVSANPSQPSQPVTLTAAVTSSYSGTPTGSVAFYSGATLLGTSSLSGGTATLSVTPPLANQFLIAIYSGDNTFASSTAQLQWQGVPTYSWTQSPVANPSVTSPGTETNTEGNNVSLQIQASDPNHYPLSYDAVGLPPGLSINSSTGLVSGTIAYGAAEDFDGTYTPTVIVANNQGGSTQTSFSWTINQAQVAPVFTSPGNQSNLTGDNVSLQMNVTQVDNDPISYSASNLPDGLSIDAETGLISGTVAPDAATGVPYAITVTATDDSTNLSTSQTFTWTINTSTAAPIWTAPGNQSNAVGDAVDLQLSASDANSDALTYTASGLPPGLTLDPIAGTITGNLPSSAGSSTPYNVTVMASNGISSSSQTFTWTVNPISLPNPGTQSNLDGDKVSLQLTASDANNKTLTYSATGLPSGLSIDSSSGLISGTLATTADTSSPYNVTVTASDGTNSASQSFTWTVARLALNPVNNQESQEGTSVSLQLSATDHVGTPTYSATGLPPGLSINSTTGLISGTVGLGSFGSSPYQVTVTATDGSNTSSQSFVWTVTPRVALVNPGPQGNATGDSVSLQLSATSPGGSITYTTNGLPSGLSLNSSTGLISGTLPTSDTSSTPYNVTVTANDSTSRSSQTFQWTISAINLTSLGDQTNNDGDAVSLSLTTGYHGSGTLSYSAAGLPPGLSINSTTGKISGTLSGTADTNSPYSVTVTVTDGTNTASQTFNWVVNAVVSITSVNNQSNADGDVVSLQVSASDSLNKTLTYSATNLPSGLSINSTTGLISGTISAGADANSPYAVTVTATDSAGNSASQTFTWTVTPVGLVNPGPQSSVDGQAVSLQLQGSSGAIYTATGLPSGVSLNSSTGLISGTLASNADKSSPYVITATATLGGKSINQTFVWTVTPTGLALPNDQTNTEGDTVSLQLQGLSSGGTLTYSASGLPNGLSLNPTTGLIGGTIAPGAAANGPYTVDAAVTNGNVSASQSFTWNINPIVNLTAPADQNNKEGDSVSLQLAATDALNKPLTYSAAALPSGLSISSSGLISGTIATGDFSGGPYTVAVTASDGIYRSSQAFTWNIAQTNPTTPTLTNPGTQTNGASDSVNLPIHASDADGDALTYSATNLPDGLDIDPNSGIISGILAEDAPEPMPYQVTVTAADGNGLSASQTFMWVVNAPALNVQAAPINAVEGVDPGSVTLATFTTADLNSLPDDFTATITFGDGDTDTGYISGGNGSFTVMADHVYAEKGSYAVSVTITDSLTGASATANSTATVTDASLTLTGGMQLGVLQQQSANLTLATFTDGNPNASASDYTATINWGDGSGTQAGTVVANADGLFSISGHHTYSQDGTYTVTVTVTDVDGNTATATSTVVAGDIYAGIASTLTVAAFTDIDHNTRIAPYTATIQWGDGTQSKGTITGAFGVQGTHTYAQDSLAQPGGVYTVTVSITDSDGAALTSTSTVMVVRPQMSLTVANVNLASSLTVSNAPVALFTEPDASDTAGEFTAQIAWGDGNSSSGTIQEVTPGLFTVLGSHTYAAYGWYTMTVTISQGWGSMAAAAEGAGENGGKPIVLVNQNYQPASTLSVARWMNSFTKSGNLLDNPKGWPQATRGAYFISLDPARFYVQVEDKAANTNPNQKDTITTDIASSSDTGHTITLTETGNNTDIFRSQPLLLTTFAVDKAAGGNQTLIANLRDTVSAIYRQQEAQATVPVKAVVKLHINILRVTPGGAPVTTIAQVKKDILAAQKIYAAAGIRLALAGNTILIANPPTKLRNYTYKGKGFNYLQNGLLSHFIWGFNWDSRGQVATTVPEQNLLGDATLRCNCNNDIEVYYVNYLAQANGQAFPKGGYGESFPYSLVSRTKPQYADSVIIAAKTEADAGAYQTLAHEIGHILMNSGKHYGPTVNLMYDPYLFDGLVTDSRRITAAEVTAMLNDRKKLLLPPP